MSGRRRSNGSLCFFIYSQCYLRFNDLRCTIEITLILIIIFSKYGGLWKSANRFLLVAMYSSMRLAAPLHQFRTACQGIVLMSISSF